jgi:uncharacterized membrane protein (UPF0127 family)
VTQSLGVARRALLLAVAAVLVSSPALARGLKVERLDVVTRTGVHHFKVEVADTEATRDRGLMFRTSLKSDRGMLFDFKQAAGVSFWMRNTLIPLDIIFIAADGHVVSIARNAVPHDETPIPSGGAVLGVLEMRGGRAAEIGAMPGDVVRHRIFHR